MRTITEFAPRKRVTRYDYDAWFDGAMHELDPADTYGDDPDAVVNAARAYARRNDFAAVIFVAHRREGRRLVPVVQVWGDRSRTYQDGPTQEIALKLIDAGYRSKRRSRAPRIQSA